MQAAYLVANEWIIILKNWWYIIVILLQISRVGEVIACEFCHIHVYLEFLSEYREMKTSFKNYKSNCIKLKFCRNTEALAWYQVNALFRYINFIYFSYFVIPPV